MARRDGKGRIDAAGKTGESASSQRFAYDKEIKEAKTFASLSVLSCSTKVSIWEGEILSARRKLALRVSMAFGGSGAMN